MQINKKVFSNLNRNQMHTKFPNFFFLLPFFLFFFTLLLACDLFNSMWVMLAQHMNMDYIWMVTVSMDCMVPVLNKRQSNDMDLELDMLHMDLDMVVVVALNRCHLDGH